LTYSPVATNPDPRRRSFTLFATGLYIDATDNFVNTSPDPKAIPRGQTDPCPEVLTLPN